MLQTGLAGSSCPALVEIASLVGRVDLDPPREEHSIDRPHARVFMKY